MFHVWTKPARMASTGPRGSWSVSPEACTPMSHAGFSSPKMVVRVLASGVSVTVISDFSRDSTMVTGLPFPASMLSGTCAQS